MRRARQRREGTDLASTSPEKTAYDPNAGEWIPTTCNMCFNNCSIKAHVIDGVIVELTGNPDSPYRLWPHLWKRCRRHHAAVRSEPYPPNP